MSGDGDRVFYVWVVGELVEGFVDPLVAFVWSEELVSLLFELVDVVAGIGD